MWAQENAKGYHDKSLNVSEVPVDGMLYEMYHGTTSEAAVSIIKYGFMRSPDGVLGSGVYLSRSHMDADNYPKGYKGENVVLKLRVNVGSCVKIDTLGHPFQKTWHSHYNFAWTPFGSRLNMVGCRNENCISDPDRIKVIGVASAPFASKRPLEELIKHIHQN